ncbi:MAG: hypothetical protein ACXW4P_23095 [Thermoanaerobaculia bacterium]
MLDYEGEISLAGMSASEALAAMRRWNAEYFEAWQSPAMAAVAALGTEKVQAILEKPHQR